MLCRFLICLTFLTLPSAAAAQDASAEDTVIVITGADGEGRRRLTGEIVEYTGRELQLRRLGDRLETIPADRIEKIETTWTPAQLSADQRWAQAKWSEALELYRQALAADGRRWVRRLILARQARCYGNLGQVEQAGETLLLVYGDDPATQYLDALPLAWQTGEPPANVRRRAEAWMNDSTAAARLLGASWLLSTAARAEATAVLQQLSDNRDTRIALLAEAQLWRTRLVTADASEVQRWQQMLQRLPPALQAGPWYIVGQALVRHEQPEEAALALLRTALMYPEQHELAAASMYDAARLLERTPGGDDPQVLYRELVSRFSETSAAARARQRLSKQTPEAGAAP